MGIEEKLPSGVLLTSVEKIAGWARARSVWPATFGLACCAIELMMTGGPRHDLARFGMEKTGSTPREADLMIVAGRVSQKMAQVGDLDGRLRVKRRHVQQLRDRAGRRSHRAGRHLPARLPPAPGDADGLDPQAARQDHEYEARAGPRRGDHRAGNRAPEHAPAARQRRDQRHWE